MSACKSNRAKKKRKTVVLDGLVTKEIDTSQVVGPPSCFGQYAGCEFRLCEEYWEACKEKGNQDGRRDD